MKEGQRCSPAPQQARIIFGLTSGRALLVWHLRAIGRAAALALARVLAFATVVARLAAALALTGVLSLTGVLFLHLLVSLLLCVLGRGRSLRASQQIGSMNAGTGAREQARDCRASYQEPIHLCHFRLRPPVDFDSTAALPADCPP